MVIFGDVLEIVNVGKVLTSWVLLLRHLSEVYGFIVIYRNFREILGQLWQIPLNKQVFSEMVRGVLSLNIRVLVFPSQRIGYGGVVKLMPS